MSSGLRTTLALGVLLGCGLQLGCGDPPAPSPMVVPEPSGVVAMSVGPEKVTATSLAAVAAQDGTEPSAAVDSVLFDAVLAAEARRRLDPRDVRLLTSRVLARAVVNQIWREARNTPIDPGELKEATDVFWLQYARPEGRRTAHAVAIAKPADSAEVHADAEALAHRILDAVRAPVAKVADEPTPRVDPQNRFGPQAFRLDPILKAFMGAANQAKKNTKLEVIVQELPAVARDSLQLASGVPRGSTFDPAYTEAAWALAERGQLSAVVKSTFGYHVIVLLEVTPANMLSPAEREAQLRERILTVRGQRQRLALLKQLEGAANISVVANHAALLNQINVRVDTRQDTDDAGTELRPAPGPR